MSARDAIEQAGGLHSASDLARRWGVSKPWVANLTRRDGFPAPILTGGNWELWLGDEADAAFIAHEERMVARSRRIGPRS